MNQVNRDLVGVWYDIDRKCRQRGNIPAHDFVGLQETMSDADYELWHDLLPEWSD